MPYSDYPKSASEEARRALKHRENNGTNCGTAVGWRRANQLAKREALSIDTVKRTYSFLSRSKVYDQGRFKDDDGNDICGSIMYSAWGGDSMLRWAETVVNKLSEPERTMDNLKISRHVVSVQNDGDNVIITFAKPDMDENVKANAHGGEKTKEQSRAETPVISVGDYVSWLSSSGRSYGRVSEISDDSDLEADTGFVIRGTSENPAVLIEVYDYDETAARYVPRDPQFKVVHQNSQLTKEDSSKFSAPSASDSRGLRASNFEASSMSLSSEEGSIEGYGIVFQSDSTPMYVQGLSGEKVKVVERISPECMRDTDMSDLVATFNHNYDYILGRTSNGTMEVRVDDTGVYYKVKASKTSYSRDLMENLRVGNVTGSSFYFLMDADAGYEFKERADGSIEATPKRITKVFEMGPVTSPAYPATTSERRSALLEQTQNFLSMRHRSSGHPQQESDIEPSLEPDKSVAQAIAAHKRRKFVNNLRKA